MDYESRNTPSTYHDQSGQKLSHEVVKANIMDFILRESILHGFIM